MESDGMEELLQYLFKSLEIEGFWAAISNLEQKTWGPRSRRMEEEEMEEHKNL